MRKVFFLFIIMFFYYFFTPHIYFHHPTLYLPLDEEIKPYDYIKEYYKITPQEIKIINEVDNQKCGKYQIHYLFSYQKKTLNIIIIDNIPPIFETISKKILINENIEAKDCIKNLYDQTPTKIYFKEQYLFDEEKTYKVEIIAEDFCHNKTTHHTYILVEKEDKQAPIIKGITNIQIRKGMDFDYMRDLEYEDDHDQNPQIIIDDHQFNKNKEGIYEIIYTIKDKSNNLNQYHRQIEVISPYDNIDVKKDGIKTCYLTFDDGPSLLTKDVLEILDQYHIKATFFVTGSQKDSYHYLKEIKEKGHVLGLHSFSHDYQDIYHSVENYMNDLKKIKQLVKDETGEDIHYIRFPGGSSNLVSKKYNKGIMKRLTKKVIDEGYQYYDWSCINGDGENINNVKELLKKAKEEIGEKEDIMFLMHDGKHNEKTVEALPYLLDYLISKGYEFHVIDDYSPTFHHHIQN